MINSYYLFSIIFRLLNFVVLIGLGIFWYRRSVRATMLDLKKKKEDRFTDLIQENNNLILDKKRLEHEQQKQQQEAQHHLERIAAWRTSVEASNAAQKKEYELLQEKVKARLVLQEKNWKADLLHKIVLEPTLKKTELILEKKFNLAKNNSEYVSLIVGYLEKSV